MSLPLSKYMMSIALYSDNIIPENRIAISAIEISRNFTWVYLLFWLFLLYICCARNANIIIFKTLGRPEYRKSDSFHRGCTVSSQEGATMSEYTVDWTINVSVGVQTFFFLLFRFIIFSFGEPRAMRHHTQERRRLCELFDRCFSGSFTVTRLNSTLKRLTQRERERERGLILNNFFWFVPFFTNVI